MLILKRISFPLSLRQHQLSDSKLAPFSAHVSLCYFAVGCVSRSVAVRLRVCYKLVQNTIFFFRLLHWSCLISSLSHPFSYNEKYVWCLCNCGFVSSACSEGFVGDWYEPKLRSYSSFRANSV